MLRLIATFERLDGLIPATQGSREVYLILTADNGHVGLDLGPDKDMGVIYREYRLCSTRLIPFD